MDFWNLFEELYPIQRTVLGEGVERSLQILQRFGIALKVLSLPSGTQCGSWTVLDEWRVRRAQLRTVTGKIMLDYTENPHCLWQHSVPFRGRISRAELLQDHMRWTERAPLATPLAVTYYKRCWGFSAPQALVHSLTEPEYEVEIDTSFAAGQMTIGFAELAGSSGRAVLLDAVISCGSLANNLSGAVALAELYRRIAVIPARRLTYRFIWSPETIGPIALAYHFPKLLECSIGGANLQNLADRGSRFFLKESRPGNTVVDRALTHVLKTRGISFESERYSVATGECGNEKAYNSLGIEFPMSAFRRTQLGRYPEYDTNLDNLQFVSAEKLTESLAILTQMIDAIESNRTFKHNFKGEPFLTGFGLFENIESDEDRIPYDYLMAFSSGSEDLLSIAARAARPIGAFQGPLARMLKAGLLREVA